MVFARFTLIIIFLIGLPCMASPLKLVTDKGQIFVPELKGWELGKDMFGMPFIYFSPQVNGLRSNISFTSTGNDITVELNKLGQDIKAYEKIKRDWATLVKATPQKFLPYHKWKNDHGHEVHEIGLEFSHQGEDLIEKSYYVDCRSKLLFAKSMLSKKNLSHQNDFKLLMQDLDCSP